MTSDKEFNYSKSMDKRMRELENSFDKEFNLSDKKINIKKIINFVNKIKLIDNKVECNFILDGDVKEFIKRQLDFKWDVHGDPWKQIGAFLYEFKKEAGGKLTW